MTPRSPLRYLGGKGNIADWLISLMPEHLHYVEPYFGGGSILLSKPESLVEGHSEVANDLDGHIVNLFRVMQSPSGLVALVSRLHFTPFAEAEFERARKFLESYQATDEPDVDAAWAYFVTNRQSRAGMMESFATLSRNRLRRQMNEQVSAWETAIDELDGFCARLQRVVLMNRNALDVIRGQDGPNTFFMLDPPYVPSTRVAGTYKHEMSLDDHKELLDLLSTIQGSFMLCGYHNELYDKWAYENGIEVIEKKVVAHSSSSKVKPERVEVVWRQRSR